MKKINSLIAAMLVLFFTSAFAQSTYDASGTFPYSSSVLLNTESTSSSTGWTEIHAYNDGGTGNTWSSAEALPFAFDFFGTPVTHFVVSKNFLLSFDTLVAGNTLPSSIDDNTALPNANLPNNTIAYFWDNFANGTGSLGTNDDIWVKTFGTAPNRQFWIKNFSFETGGRSFTYNFLVLEETTNKIYFLDARNATASVGSMTIGAQLNGSVAVQVTGSPNIAAINGNTTAIGGDYYELSPRLLVPNDAGVVSIDAPTSPMTPGNQAVTATIINQGTATLSTATVNWSVNGMNQTPITYNGPLASNATASVNLGNYNFTGISTIKVWTSMPNGSPDGNTANDTMSVGVYPGLSGTYTIDSSMATSGTNFNNFSDFESAVSQGGLLGAITVNVAANTYNESLLLSNVLGSSATNTITIDGGDSSTTVLNSTGNFYGIAIENTDYVTIQNMGFRNEGTTAMNVIFGNGSDYSTVQNCELKVLTNTTSSNVNNIGTSNSITTRSTGANSNHNMVSNNHIVGGYYGVYFYGSTSTIQVDNQANNNFIDSAYYYGIYGYYQDSMKAIGNNADLTIRGNAAADGLYGFVNNNFEFTGNNLIALDYGFYVSNSNASTPQMTRRSLIANNMIGSGGDYGMYLYSVDSVDIYHNTVATNSTSSPAFLIGQSTSYRVGGYDVRNNIFASATTEAFETTTAISDTVMLKFDNNVFYTQGTNLINISGTQYANLVAYQAASPAFNASSYEGDPLFMSLTALHVFGAVANDVGDNTVGITVDIDGDVRPAAGATSVDIGADEYTPPNCLIPSSFNASNVTNSSALLSWFENGTATQWEVEWDTAGFTAGMGRFSSIVNTDTFTTVTALMSQTNYEAYVRAICGRGDTSSWSAVAMFTTACNPQVAPYNENFDGLALTSPYTDLPICWEPQVGPDFWDVTNDVVNTGHTYLPNIGDHTTGSGNYMWIDASSDIVGNGMVSPLIDMSGLTTPFAGIWFASNNTNNNVNHTIVLEVWNGAAWDTVATKRGNFPGWVEVSGTIPTGVPSTTKFRVRAEADPTGTSSTYYFNDLGVDDFFVIEKPSCVDPTNISVTTLSTSEAEVNWTDNANASTWHIQWDTAGFTPGTGNLNLTTNNPDTLTGLMASTSYDVWVRAICGSGDSSAWVGPISFTTPCPPVTMFPYVENFENNLACWSQSNVSGAANWTTAAANNNSTVTPLNGNSLGYFYSGNYAGDATYLISPILDLSGVTNPQISFSYSQVAWGADQDTLGVYYRSSSSASWTYLTSYNANTTAWTRETILLPNASADYSIALLGYSGWGRGVTIDSLVVEPAPACIAPSMVSVMTPSVDTAIINWTENNGSMNWEISYGTSGFTAGMGTQVLTTNNPDTITGLMANTAYDFYVRTICGSNDTSAWSMVSSVSTPCLTVTSFPYVENFENNLACWSQSYVTGTVDWVQATANQNSSVTPLNGSGMALFYTGSYNDEASYLISPTLDLSGLNTPELSFFHTQVDWSGDQDTLGVYYRTSSAGSWTYLASYNASIATWTQVTLTLPNPSSDYQIGLLGYGDWGYGVTIDSLVVSDQAMTSVCGVPTSLMASNIGIDSAIVSWIDTNSTMAPEYEYSYGSVGFTAGMGTQVIVSSTTDTIRGLMANTSYDWYVRAICAPGDTSMWSALSNFSTSMMIPMDPYYPIGTINTIDANGVADSNGVRCWISGTTIGYNRRGSGHDFAIVDMASGSQEGITVFEFNPVNGYAFQEGDSLMILGDVSQFRGLTQFRPDSIILLKSNATIPTPMVANNIDESTESVLINMTDDFVLLSLPSTSGSSNFDVTNGIDTIEVRIDSDSDIEDSLAVAAVAWSIGDTLCGMIGVGGQYTASATQPTYFDGYQFFPRSWNDITFCRNTTSIEAVNAIDELSIYPNPTTSNITIEHTGFNSTNVRFELRDLSGRVIKSIKLTSPKIGNRLDIDMSDAANGIYFLNILDGEERRIEKIVKH